MKHPASNPPGPAILDQRRERPQPKRHFEVALLLVTLGAALVIGRFFHLQVVQGIEYEELARIHHVGRERLPARRGVIKDRRGRLLARNIASHQLSVIPHYVKEPEAEFDRLAELLGWSTERRAELLDKVLQAKEGKRRFNRLTLVRELVSMRCPYDQSELELGEPAPGRWCAECGRYFSPLPTGKRAKCPDGRPLAMSRDGSLGVCERHGLEYSDAHACPYDEHPLAPRTTILTCPTCKRHFDNEEAMVRAHLHELPGVYIDTEMRRHYPERELMSHVLGYMNQVNDRDMESWPDVYQPGDYIGRSGVERSMEEVLRGEHGVEVFVKDVRGLRLDESQLPPEVASQQGREAANGQNLWLTIDSDLQRVARAALRYHRSGAVVVMDPHSGEVLAMHSKPEYDPNVWSGRLTRAAKEEYDANPYSPMINKATTAFAPGSIYKIVTVLAGLREGLVTTETASECRGYYEFGGRRFRCHRRTGHGPGIRLHESLLLSCDIYYYLLGETLGMDRLHTYGQDIFLLGQKTGIELPEQIGRVPSKDWYRRYGSIGWQPGFTLSTAVGQGALTTTPLQMARVYSALVNGGIVYRPMLVRQLEDEHGNITRRFRPEAQGTLPFRSEHVDAVRAALVGVVNDTERGTANGIRMDNLVIAGKTGTAEARTVAKDASEEVAHWLLQDHAWFAAYAPASDPQIVVVAFVEHGGSGGKVAAPVAKQVIEQYFRRGLGAPDPEQAAPRWQERLGDEGDWELD